MPQLILVVEDEPPVLRITCQHLEDAGYDCITATTAAQALQIVEQAVRFDLFLLDIRLPDLPGPELAFRLHERRPDVPILFVSGWVDGLATPTKLEPLHWDFVQKPFTSQELIRAIQKMLGATSHQPTVDSA